MLRNGCGWMALNGATRTGTRVMDGRSRTETENAWSYIREEPGMTFLALRVTNSLSVEEVVTFPSKRWISSQYALRHPLSTIFWQIRPNLDCSQLNRCFVLTTFHIDIVNQNMNTLPRAASTVPISSCTLIRVCWSVMFFVTRCPNVCSSNCDDSLLSALELLENSEMSR